MKANVYARNLAANWLGHGASMLVLFFLSPFLVNTLGDTQYGIWGLLNVLVGYLGIFDMGVRASTGRYVVYYLGKRDNRRLNQTIQTGLTCYSALAVLIALAGAVMGWLFPDVFRRVPPEYVGMLRWVLPAMALSVWLSAISAVFSSVLTAHDRFDLARGVDLGVLAIRTVATVWVLKAGAGLVGLVIVWTGSNLLAAVGNALFARRVHPQMRWRPLRIVRGRLRELVGFGAAASVGKIATQIIGQTDLILVGMLISVPMVTTYKVGATLVYYSWTFLMQIGGTFFPPVQRSICAGDLDSARWLFVRQVRLSLILGIAVYVGFWVFGGAFLQLWMVGEEFHAAQANQAAGVMAILSASKLVFLCSIGAAPLLTALGHVKFNAVVSIVEAVLNLALSVFFVVQLGWGLAGVAAGTLTSRVLIRAGILPWYACRKAGMNLRRFLTDVGAWGLLVGGLFAIWCLLLREVVPSGSWPWFSLQVLLALAGYAPIATWGLVPRHDRQRIWRKLHLVPVGQKG